MLQLKTSGSQAIEMATKLPRADSPVRLKLMVAAKQCLLRDGFAALSTRAVAEEAETQLSQIHYHFGSKHGLILALLEHQNEALLARQSQMFGAETPLSLRWLQSCDFLEEDLRSGFVRVLQEIIAGGYSDLGLAAAAREVLKGWFVLLNSLAAEIKDLRGVRPGLPADQLACLIGLAFLGAESMILINTELPVIASLRSVGALLASLEISQMDGQNHAR